MLEFFENLNNEKKICVAAGAGMVIGLGTIITIWRKYSRKSKQKSVPVKTAKKIKESLSAVDNKMQYAGIETGGTSCNVGISRGSITNIIEKINIPTTKPAETVGKIVDWLSRREFVSLGISAFGPLCLDKTSPQYGSVTSTPKLPWQNFPLQNSIAQKLFQKTGKKYEIPIDTDVNGCAFFEYKEFQNEVRENIAYITVGTGIGIGLVVNKSMVHGLVHPEGGHMKVAKLSYDKDFKGVCPFHGDCLEGMATNNSIAARLKCSIENLANISDSDPVWLAVGHYLAQACLNLTLIGCPEKIVIGGGVMNRGILFKIIRQEFTKLLNKYVQHPKLQDVENYIVPSKHFPNNGLMSAMLLGKEYGKVGI